MRFPPTAGAGRPPSAPAPDTSAPCAASRDDELVDAAALIRPVLAGPMLHLLSHKRAKARVQSRMMDLATPLIQQWDEANRCRRSEVLQRFLERYDRNCLLMYRTGQATGEPSLAATMISPPVFMHGDANGPFHGEKTIAEVEGELGSRAMLLFTRITAALRLTYLLPHDLFKLLRTIYVFLRGPRYMTTFIEIGGVQLLVDLVFKRNGNPMRLAMATSYAGADEAASSRQSATGHHLRDSSTRTPRLPLAPGSVRGVAPAVGPRAKPADERGCRALPPGPKPRGDTCTQSALQAKEARLRNHGKDVTTLAMESQRGHDSTSVRHRCRHIPSLPSSVADAASQPVGAAANYVASRQSTITSTLQRDTTGRTRVPIGAGLQPLRGMEKQACIELLSFIANFGRVHRDVICDSIRLCISEEGGALAATESDVPVVAAEVAEGPQDDRTFLTSTAVTGEKVAPATERTSAAEHPAHPPQSSVPADRKQDSGLRLPEPPVDFGSARFISQTLLGEENLRTLFLFSSLLIALYDGSVPFRRVVVEGLVDVVDRAAAGPSRALSGTMRPVPVVGGFVPGIMHSSPAALEAWNRATAKSVFAAVRTLRVLQFRLERDFLHAGTLEEQVPILGFGTAGGMTDMPLEVYASEAGGGMSLSGDEPQMAPASLHSYCASSHSQTQVLPPLPSRRDTVTRLIDGLFVLVRHDDVQIRSECIEFLVQVAKNAAHTIPVLNRCFDVIDESPMDINDDASTKQAKALKAMLEKVGCGKAMARIIATLPCRTPAVRRQVFSFIDLRGAHRAVLKYLRLCCRRDLNHISAPLGAVQPSFLPPDAGDDVLLFDCCKALQILCRGDMLSGLNSGDICDDDSSKGNVCEKYDSDTDERTPSQSQPLQCSSRPGGRATPPPLLSSIEAAATLDGRTGRDDSPNGTAAPHSGPEMQYHFSEFLRDLLGPHWFTRMLRSSLTPQMAYHVASMVLSG